MKTVTTYIAFDDTEFDTEKECLAYEQHYLDLIIEIDECYDFLDKDMYALPLMYSHNIEESCDEFDKVFDYCDCVIVNRIPSTEATAFLWNFFGYELPKEVGLWRYNYKKCDWERA